MLAGVQERARERAREELRRRAGAFLPTLKPEAPAAPGSRPVVTPQPIPRPAPEWPVEIRLPKGGRIRASMTPAAARRNDLDAFGRVSAANDRQAAAVIQHQSEALDRLQQSHDELTRKVAAIQEQADLALLNLLKGFEGFEQTFQQVTKRQETLRAQTVSTRSVAARQREELRSMAMSARIEQVTAVVNSVQSAAYGQRGSLLATDNLLLAGNQLFWMFIDPFLRSLGIITGPSPSMLAWLSPLGSLVTGHVALGNRQHERFISGVSTFDGKATVVVESLRSRIASGYRDEFQRRRDVAVTIAPLDPMAGATFSAAVIDGDLRIEAVGDSPPEGRVAWIVDTGADIG